MSPVSRNRASYGRDAELGGASSRVQGQKDEDGSHLLKHARIYTLAEKLGMDELKTLAHAKIHKINSTARGELEYARYVYANTPKEDKTNRTPIATYRAHNLLTGIWPGERIVDKVSRFVDIEESCNDS